MINNNNAKSVNISKSAIYWHSKIYVFKNTCSFYIKFMPYSIYRYNNICIQVIIITFECSKQTFTLVVNVTTITEPLLSVLYLWLTDFRSGIYIRYSVQLKRQREFVVLILFILCTYLLMHRVLIFRL